MTMVKNIEMIEMVTPCMTLMADANYDDDNDGDDHDPDNNENIKDDNDARDADNYDANDIMMIARTTATHKLCFHPRLCNPF